MGASSKSITRWYLLAFDEFRNQVRVYAVSRIQSARETPDPFQIPDSFRIEDHIDPHFGIFNEGTWFTVRVRVQPWVADIVTEHLNVTDIQRDVSNDGLVELSWRTNQHEELKHWTLRWSEHMVVVEPMSLAQELLCIAKFYQETYGQVKS